MDDGLGFLEFGDGEGAAQAADAALLAALGEAIVDRRPRVRPEGACVDLAADVDAGGEDANATEYGLAAGIFTSNISTCRVPKTM